MKDKRTAQISLPLGIPPEQSKGYVMQSMRMTFARQKKISVVAKRIVAKVFEQVKTNDHQFKPFYRIHISEVVPADADMSSAYKAVRQSFDELAQQVWFFEDEVKQKFIPKHLLDTTKTEKDEGFECGYNNGWITVVINKSLEPYLIQLVRSFTIYDLKYYMTFKSWYSMQMYEKLSHFKDTGVWYVSVEEFRKQMDCVDKYPETKDLVKYTLSEPIKELEPTNLAFDYTLQKPDKIFGRGRKPVTGFHFRLKKKELRDIPMEWYEFSDDHKHILLRLLDFKVSESNIVRYAKAIGIENAKKLVRDWEMKEHSKKRIDNKEKYCNAVWVRMGKASLEKQKLSA